MQNKHLSVCLLAYKRPEWLIETIESIKNSADYPYTLIVNSDGNDDLENKKYLTNLVDRGDISILVNVSGKNRGVGRSFANCIGVSEGDYIAKVDTDLTFTKGWMSESVKLLEKYSNIGAVGLFDYTRYDQNDKRFVVKNTNSEYREVEDLVSSVYVFRREDLIHSGWTEDDGFHQTLKQKKGVLALTKEDLVHNRGFGIGKSVYVVGTMESPRKAEICKTPLIYD